VDLNALRWRGLVLFASWAYLFEAVNDRR
jgi:hypothetical protein